MPYQEYDSIFDDALEWSDNNDMPQQSTPPRSPSRFHKRSGTENIPFDEPAESGVSRLDKPENTGSFSRDEAMNRSTSRFNRRNAGTSPISHPSETEFDNIAPTGFDDEDGFFRMEETAGPLSDTDDLFADFSDNSSRAPTRSFAGFFILTGLLVVMICATFIVKSLLSKNHGQLPFHTDASATVSATDSDAIDTAETNTAEPDAARQATTAAPTETQTTATVASDYQTLKMGDKNKDVKKMQDRLFTLGYIGEGSCTGYFGDYTEKIVKRFQKKAGLDQTGIADNETLTRLYADDAPKWR